MEHTATYDSAAPKWDRKTGRLGYFTAYSSLLEGRVLASGPVLDVGTGTAAFARTWLAHGGSRNLSILDPSSQMLARARDTLETMGVRAVSHHTSIEDFDPPHQYRAILAAHVIEHCISPAGAFERFADWLEPGGRVYLVVSKPHWCNWLIWLRFRHKWFSEGTLREMAYAAGLRHDLSHDFDTGPPARTSRAYVFHKP